jgi:methylated-DNA-[protein]-cysteine S-methyltransferase
VNAVRVTTFALFDTAIGPCAIAWSERGVVAVALPEASAAATRGRLLRRFPGSTEREPTAEVRRAIDGIVSLLRDGDADFTAVELDLAQIPPFSRRVYEIARAIPAGATLTYGEVATRLGDPGAARAVGQALGENPFPLIVPCHRVLAADGKLGGFSAPGGVVTKRRLLTIEGALTDRELPLFRPA